MTTSNGEHKDSNKWLIEVINYSPLRLSSSQESCCVAVTFGCLGLVLSELNGCRFDVYCALCYNELLEAFVARRQQACIFYETSTTS